MSQTSQSLKLKTDDQKKTMSPRRCKTVVNRSEKAITRDEQVTATDRPPTGSPSRAKPILQHQQTMGSPSKSSKPHKSAAWKTSKFFSRTMTSGELLKGIKKISLAGPEPLDSSRVFKNFDKSRLSSLRKKTEIEEQDLDLSSSSTGPKGIVCKKEDLKCLFSGGFVKKDSENPVTVNKKMPPKYVRSSSFDPSTLSKDTMEFLKKESPKDLEKTKLVRSTSSDDHKERKKSLQQQNISEQVEETVPENLPQRENKEDKDSKEEKVQWDESEFFDASMIGGAIEAFLKGSLDSSVAVGAEKRVSFQ